jgi:hypothetical protein
MIDTHELHSLTRWCASRRLRWLPVRTDAGEAAIQISAQTGRLAWSDMLLVADAEDDVSLVDAAGQIIATASDVPALLDALDAGLLGPTPLAEWPAYMARSSAPLWNRSGSAST